jgi:hypothetical protein
VTLLKLVTFRIKYFYNSLKSCKRERAEDAFGRFEVGSHGGCEAALFEFRESAPYQEAETALRESTRISARNAVRMAAMTFDEAFTYLRWTQPEFKIDRVQNMGIIILVSGSPVD